MPVEQRPPADSRRARDPHAAIRVPGRPADDPGDSRTVNALGDSRPEDVFDAREVVRGEPETQQVALSLRVVGVVVGLARVEDLGVVEELDVAGFGSPSRRGTRDRSRSSR